MWGATARCHNSGRTVTRAAASPEIPRVGGAARHVGPETGRTPARKEVR